MKLTTHFHQLEATDAIKDKIQDKANKLNKFFDGDMTVTWTCSVEKQGHKSHVEVRAKGATINADSTQSDLYKTFDDVIQKVEKQLSKLKSQVKDHIHHKHEASPSFGE